ncbi:MAG: hypothetical protein ACOYKE_02625 [Ferruginibacter sp.]
MNNTNPPLPKQPALLICILLDIVGYASYIIPGLGEFADIIWAPLSAYIFYKLFGGKLGLIGGVLDFLEEALPFTDFIPSFSIAWIIRKLSSSTSNPPFQKHID